MKENPDTNMNDSNERIDELLNCYIDDELTAEQKAEVESLVGQDVKIANRLRQFQKCRIFVGSMPVAEAPAGVLEGVKASLSELSLPDEQLVYEEQSGRKYILLRKVLAAAAMIGLAAVLSTVIHRFVPVQSTPEAPPARIVTTSEFSGRLELKTNALNAVDAFIKSAIDDNAISASNNLERQQGRRIYSLSCSNKGLNSLLTDLDKIWSKLDSATLFVDTEVFGVQTEVDAVTTKQIAKIAGQENSEKRIELAKDFAVINSMAEQMPDKEIRVAIEAGKPDLAEQWQGSKPVLTEPQKIVKKPVDQVQEKQDVHLTIILDW
jgi:hypothetical protein